MEEDSEKCRKCIRILERAKVLADMPIGQLRTIAAGFDCDAPPPQSEVRILTSGKSRGELIEWIIDKEEDVSF